MRFILASLSLIVCVVSASFVEAAPRLKGKLTLGSGEQLLAIAPDGSSKSTSSSSFTLTLGNKTGLYLLENSSVKAMTVFGIVKGKKVFSLARAKANGICGSASAVTSLKLKKSKGNNVVNLGRLNRSESGNVLYPKRTVPKNQLNLQSLAEIDSNCEPVGAGSLGLSSVGGNARSARAFRSFDGELEVSEPGEDQDGDGMPNVLDIDDDDDGVLDNDDSDNSSGNQSSAKSFWVFSNFHVDIDKSLNANAASVTQSQIDSVMREHTGLAMQVAGPDDAEVELDCGSLEYCSAGGVGRGKEPYPDGLEFPEDVDSDGDGEGTLTAGSTGDFQLACFSDAEAGYAASEKIAAGDVYIQRYTDSNGKVVEVPGMLNFVFHTNPAVKSVETGVRTYTPSYPVSAGGEGSIGNCFHVPETGDVSITITGWRPQRKGITSAGEAELMDMGNLRIIANIPSGPCPSGFGGSCEQGPGVCGGSFFTTSDPNLTVVSDGLQDSLGDTPADPSNTFTYTFNLSGCIESVSGVSWDPGEEVRLPFQMMNVYGDNTVQNICFVRDNS